MDLTLKGCQASEKENFFWVTEEYQKLNIFAPVKWMVGSDVFFWWGFGLFSGAKMLVLGSVMLYCFSQKQN